MSLELRDIHKAFGPVRANDGVTLTVEAGELHGLLGENGAGKSTLMKVLSGFIEADHGTVTLHGERLELRSPRDAVQAGVGMLHQDPLVFGPFSVLDNFLLGSPGRLRLDRKAGAGALRQACDRYGFSFDPNTLAQTLTVGERQQLEIARLIWLGARVLILDEPTTGISASQREKLFEVLRLLAEDGLIVIFVSHKLEEIEQLCDRVTVMRAGQVVGDCEMPTPTEQLVEMMFGQVFVEGDRSPIDLGSVALELDRVTLSERLVRVPELTMRVHEGEVLGLAGLEGSGQRTLLKACTGLLRPESGSIRLAGADLAGRSYREHRDAGVHYLPAGRLEEGLVAGLTLTEHFELASGRRSFFVDWGKAEAEAAHDIDAHFIKGVPDSTAESLSGGNQQRLLLAMMPDDIRLLLMEHPTRGLDIESAEWVWEQILARRGTGTAIVFASADLDELLRYADRIAVFFDGRVIGVVDAAASGVDELGHLIGGSEVVT
ncbi:MAG: ATP-binding cassette domain-containing protein [Ilumatobacter sp.]|uniref:ABC transporter ATP-binding protein n=1 Tax=Ilumatobacter sp. TaxID=1967498 RepID=UPI00263571B7|nr:ATP-binding cassette domain-containing protein [Ilumatobacter sp.]MDJ0767627.1 ATP-binding cassette domain-containing protein [Ilumatobacter sp.]